MGRSRIVAGITLGDPIAPSAYGDRFHAASASRADLEALVLAPGLASHGPLRAALLDGERRRSLTALTHGALVSTLAIAEAGDDLVIVSLPPASAQPLAAVLAGARPDVAPAVAATVARALLGGLVVLHGRGLVHGALHPRSVLVSSTGDVMLADLAIGSAFAHAIAAGLDDDLWRDVRAYVAPELRTGAAPGPASDVFAAGALLSALLTGRPPPTMPRTTPGVERALCRAIDREAARRFATVAEFADHLLEAFEDDRWAFASRAEVAAAIGGSGSLADRGLDAATEDLLATLGDLAHNAPTRPSVDLRVEAAALRQAGRGDADGGLDALIAEMDADHAPPPPARAAAPASVVVERAASEVEASLDEVLDDDGVDDVIVPVVEDVTDDVGATSPPRGPAATAATRAADRTPTAAGRRRSAPIDVGSLTQTVPGKRRSSPMVAPAGTSSGVHRATPAAGTRAPTAVPHAGSAAPRRSAAMAETSIVLVDAPPPDLRGGGGLKWLLLLLSIAGVVAIVLVLTRQQTGRSAADEAARAKAAEAAAETARLTAALPDPGAIRIGSNPDGAVVWLRLDDVTPTETFKLPTKGLVQLRIERAGYVGQDVPVLASMWTGSGDAQRADVAVTLAAGSAALPADPGKPAEVAGQLFGPGHGIVAVSSTPPGAEVWLLVGVTGSMQLTGIEAGKPYVLRVHKDGYAPIDVTLDAEAWRDGGSPDVPLASAPKRAVLERTVELVPLAPVVPPKRKGGK